ncbi:hypothetical protein CH289_07635 [Rhodococcus sp. RS1C4]|nr:phage tail tape measure protein [Rhodococcus sp. RS1C4]OZC55057.1 hypothetical protein CH289_07635 [Rhodococcus sp. RS1C4]
MALDTGTIFATLELNDSRFNQSMERAERTARSLSTQLDRTASSASGSMRDAARQVGNLGDAAQDAGRQVRDLDSVPAGLGQSADRAERSVRGIGTGAREASNGLRRIDADALTRITRGAEGAGDALRQLDRWQLDALIREANRAGTSIGESVRQGASHGERALARMDAQGLQRLINDAQAARRELNQVGDAADDATDDLADVGEGAGDSAGGNFLSGFSDAISGMASKGGPIAGSILGVAALGLGVGVALASAIKDGMEQELQRDLFQAQTGVTTAQAEKFARAAGEAYADVFGESVEANLDTARVAMGNGLLDAGATQRDAEHIIGSLDAVSQILGDDIPNVARAAGNAVKSGFAADVDDAFDLLVKGGQMGLNASEDLVDTVTEYSVQFAKVGLSGAEAFGLMNQAVQGGARDTDTAADAIKEFAIRSIDGSKAAAEAYEALGLNAADMSAQIAKGGTEGTAGMEELLTKIRETEDPLVRNAVAVGLFGTKAEDMGDAMYNLDLTTAVQSMNDYEGAAKNAIGVMSGNGATSVEGAMRSISTVVDSLKGALAEAFGPQIAEWADKISNNRAGVVDFFIAVGNGGFEAAKAVASFVADGMRMLAEFSGAAAETGASFLDMGANILSVGESIPGFGAILGIATGGAAEKLRTLADATRNGGAAIDEALTKGANVIDDTLVPGIDKAQERFNEFGQNVSLNMRFSDESAKIIASISDLGEQADGSIAKLEGFTGAADEMLPPGLADQFRQLKDGFEAQTRAGLDAGKTVEELTGTYAANRDALLQQAMQMGLNNEQANTLLNSFDLFPNLVETQINQPGMPEAHLALDVLKGKVVDVPDDKTIVTEALTKDATDALSALGLKVETLPDGTTRITANTDDGQVAIDNFLRNNDGKSLQMYVELEQRRVGYWQSQGVSAADAPGMQGPVPVALPSGGGGGGSPGGGGGGFADGGAIHGPGGPRDDLIPLWGSNGEHMLDADDVAKLGGQAGVYRFRDALQRGEVGAYADGGAIGDKDAAIAYAQSKNGMPYVYGALDCSGYWSGIYNAYTGKDVRFTTDSDFAALGFVQGYDPGGFNIGTNGGSGQNGHMAGDLFGTPAESGSSGIVYGAGAQSAQDFPMVWHLPRGDDGTEYMGDSAGGGAGGSSSSSAGGSSSSGARGGDVRDVFVTNWPGGSIGGGSSSSSGGSRSSSGGGSPQAGGSAGGLLQSLNKGIEALAPKPADATKTPADDNGIRALLDKGDFTGKFRDAFGVEEDSKIVDALLEARKPGADDADGVRALVERGEFSESFRKAFGLEEDSPLVKALIDAKNTKPVSQFTAENDPNGVRALRENGDFTGRFREAFGVEEDDKLVDAILRHRDGSKPDAAQFNDENDPDGLKAIAAGDFTGRFREKFGVEEDSPLVAALLSGGRGGQFTDENDPQGIRALLESGQFTGRLGGLFGIEEDNPLLGGVLDAQRAGANALFNEQSDPDGLKALLHGGEFTDRFRSAFGVEEDSALVQQLLTGNVGGDADPDGVKALLDKGDFTGKFRDAFGAEEDSKIVDALLESRDAAKVQADAVVESSGKVSEAVAKAPVSDGGLRSSTPATSTSTPTTGASAGVQDVRITNWPFGLGNAPADPLAGPRQQVDTLMSGINSAGASGASLLQSAAAGIAQSIPPLGPPVPPTDVVPAMLTPGEIVIPKDIADKYPGLLELLKRDAVGHYAEGGTVGFFGPKDRAFEAGGSKHTETVKAWSSAQADSDAVGSGTPLTVLKKPTSGELAAENMYKTLVGAAGLAGFLSEQLEGLFSGGILNLGRETVEQLAAAFKDAAEQIPPTGDTIQGDQINGDIVTQQSNDPGAVIRNAAGAFGLRL